MKKSIKVFILCFIFLFGLCGCSIFKLSREKFKSILEKEDYEVQDATENIGDISYLVSFDAARSSDRTIEIRYYIFTESKYAKGFFDDKKKSMKNAAKYVSTDANAINWINYSSYITRTNTTYSRIIRKGNTAIYIEAPAEKTANATNIIKKLGY